ncbi:MAG: hypothetical protein HRF42_05515 [Candidatus Brocadia sp.]|jgi:hypothetical protein
MLVKTFSKSIVGIVIPAILATMINMGYAATGPNSSHDPYLISSMPGVSFTSILTVSDSVNNKSDGTPYVMVGIPDGLGAYDNKDGTFTILMNHELKSDKGIQREHNRTDPNGKGVFVSKWIVNKRGLAVLHGEDLIRKVKLWDGASESFLDSTNAVFNRLCSADLPDSEALFNRKTRKGYNGYIFMNGEETTGGRAFAHIVNGPEAGTSYELPSLGKISWEQDEESSGIIDVTKLFKGVDGYYTKKYRYFLLDVQAHKTGVPYNTPEIVEGGQLLLMQVLR